MASSLLHRTIVGDFETRSLEDVTEVGPWKYSEHPSTDALCLCYSFEEDEEVFLWHMATEGFEESPPPRELLRRLEEGWTFEAHNSMFERAIWTNVMSRRRGWYLIRLEQFRCTAARAAYHALPRKLEDVARILNLSQQKDEAGKDLIKALSKPRRMTKRELARVREEFAWSEMSGRPNWSLWFNEDRELIQRNWSYCGQDVRTERALSLFLPPMPDREVRVWHMDQAMNARGCELDLDLARAAIRLAEPEIEAMNDRLAEIVLTEDEKLAFTSKGKKPVLKATQRQRVMKWFRANEPRIVDTQAATLERFATLKSVKPEVQEVIGIMRAGNRSSTAKYQTAINITCDDARARDLVMYAGAHTLRWTGKGLQPHNFPRGTIKDMELACRIIKEGDPFWIRFLYGDIMEVLSHALRGLIVSPQGKRLWVADFAAIEARVVFWLAQCAKALDVFNRGDDIYCDLATTIYGRTITKKDKNERQMGKQAILGLGYGMGFCKFLITLRKYKIHFTKDQVIAIVGLDDCRRIAKWLRLEGKWGGAQYVKRSGLSLERDLHELVLTKYIVDLYRETYEEIPAYWKAQEKAALQCVESGRPVDCGRVTWELVPTGEHRRLLCHLPSGTDQTYWDPVISLEEDDWDDGSEDAGRLSKKLEFHGLDDKTHQWLRSGTYGGMITENQTQHFARDLMADAMVRIDDHPVYDNIMSIHDEVLAESRDCEGSAEEYHELVSRCPEYAAGCPIDAEVAKQVVYRYLKA
jgi:DNA polymerase